MLRDPIACKHAVLAETDDWVAMATEYRAIARLPGAEAAQGLGAGAGPGLQLGPRLMIEVDLREGGVRALNQRLHDLRADSNERAFRDPQPDGRAQHRGRARSGRSRSRSTGMSASTAAA